MKTKAKVMNLVLSSTILGYMMNSLIFSYRTYTKNEYEYILKFIFLIILFINIAITIFSLKKENNNYIDTVTKIAQPRIQPRAYGVNRITLSWNSIIIKMDAGMVKLVTKAVAAGGVAAPATAIPGLVSFIAANPIIGASGLAVGTSVIDSLLDSNIKDGVEIHYNFFFGHVTLVRRQ